MLLMAPLVQTRTKQFHALIIIILTVQPAIGRTGGRRYVSGALIFH